MKRALLYPVLLAALVAPMAACGDKAENGGTSAAAPSASPSPQPAEVLAAAVGKTEKQNLKFQLDEGSDPVEGTFDAASGGYTLKGGAGEDAFDFVIFPGAVYMPNPVAADGTYLKIDVTKLREQSSLRLLASPAFAVPFLSTATAVKQEASGTYSGTLDLTRVAASAGHPKALADQFAKAAGDKATAVPFTARVADGKLAEFKATFPAADQGKDLPWVMRISEIGGAVTVAAPAAAKVKDLPSSGYADV
ncbi:hypothetical protein Val02_16110 [Virgisporangium aliadipatigenens]|uniref:Lipoprotein n=1 Tax=Virgisporangium aliadipatigenens TaxID=741659 RepID=A0A8J4DNC1_9ACTN|nr:hypothetical protein [Virgisporangium aliadipatigenens]GIJ44725.1 hypothetical protein Val02_16110 [Virgisporangium aliadipatigenens]